MRNDDYHPCTFEKACHILWAVKVMGWSQTKTSIEVRVNGGDVSRVVRGLRFEDAYPVPLPDYCPA
jgi:predicted methyltransferase